MSNAPSKPVSFSRPKVGYFSNRPRTVKALTIDEFRNITSSLSLSSNSPERGQVVSIFASYLEVLGFTSTQRLLF